MVTDAEQPDDDSVYWEIVDHVESEMEFEAEHLDIEVADDFVTITGSIPSHQAYEDLEHLLFDTLDLEQVEFDVVVDEDLQTRSQKMSPDEPGSTTSDLDQGDPGINGLNNSPRRQY